MKWEIFITLAKSLYVVKDVLLTSVFVFAIIGLFLLVS